MQVLSANQTKNTENLILYYQTLKQFASTGVIEFFITFSLNLRYYKMPEILDTCSQCLIRDSGNHQNEKLVGKLIFAKNNKLKAINLSLSEEKEFECAKFYTKFHKKEAKSFNGRTFD